MRFMFFLWASSRLGWTIVELFSMSGLGRREMGTKPGKIKVEEKYKKIRLPSPTTILSLTKKPNCSLSTQAK